MIYTKSNTEKATLILFVVSLRSRYYLKNLANFEAFWGNYSSSTNSEIGRSVEVHITNSIHSYREMHCLLLHTLMLLKNDICTHSHLFTKAAHSDCSYS